MKPDIKTRKDIDFLVSSFYAHALKDNLLEPAFTAAEMDLQKHLPIIGDFWESILLDNPIFRGNPMLTHMKLHQTYPLKQELFDRWLSIWSEAVKSHFQGTKADLSISRAKSIAQLMVHKISQM